MAIHLPKYEWLYDAIIDGYDSNKNNDIMGINSLIMEDMIYFCIIV
jgi:hypothetical protein